MPHTVRIEYYVIERVLDKTSEDSFGPDRTRERVSTSVSGPSELDRLLLGLEQECIEAYQIYHAFLHWDQKYLAGDRPEEERNLFLEDIQHFSSQMKLAAELFKITKSIRKELKAGE
ncbi:hypothetical protein MMC06_005686 [Schaereria dolodes]|nr:hypothetical protein [Schaereria dolodes]